VSDSRRRYCAVKDKLRQQLPGQWAECESRMINLSLMVSAIVKAKDLTQHAVAAEMPLAAQDTSLAQRQRRWTMNEQVDICACYKPLVYPFLQAMGRASTLPLILDTTPAGANCRTLTLAVGYQRRAVPITWRTEKGKRGHTDGCLQIGLLQEVVPDLPDTTDIVVLGDGEFGHIQLITWLQSQDWNYCLRVASDTYVNYEGEWRRLDSFDVRPGEFLWLADVYLTKASAFGPVNILLTWDQANNRLLALVTNFPLLEEARYWYRKRFWIEPVFGDFKGHGFDLQTSRLRHPERISRLMLAVALAYLWLLFLGVAAVITNRAKLVDRTDRRDRSLFTIGRQTLNRLLKLDEPIVVSFFPYPLLRLLPQSGVG
jgi:hypothetical protein